MIRDHLRQIWTLRTLRRHRRENIAHSRYPIHTGRLEGVNNKNKVIKRRS